MSCILKINNLNYVVAPDKKILTDICLELRAGEFVALVGHNGAGKSSLIQHLNGLIKPQPGQVAVNGLDPATTPTSRLAQHIGFLFQNPDHQIFNNTVRNEIGFGLKNMDLTAAEKEQRINQAAQTAGLDNLLAEYPFRLSRGLRQRLAFASVLAMDPDILVLDEPTTGQDFRQSRQTMDVVAQRHRAGKTVIVVTHDMDLVLQYAQRVIVLEHGKISADGSVQTIMSDRDTLNRAGLTEPAVFRLLRSLGLHDMRVSGTEQAILGQIERELIKRLQKEGVA